MFETHTGSINFAWGCFLFPGLLIAAVMIIAFAKKKRGLALAILIPVLAVFFAAAALFTFRADRQVSYSQSFNDAATVSVPTIEDSSTRVPEPTVSGSSNLSTPLAESPLDVLPPNDSLVELDADIYPSNRTAAIAITRRILRSLDQIVPAGVKLDRLVIRQGAPEIRSVVADTARNALPGVNIILDENPAEPKEGETRAFIALDTPTFSTETQITATLFSTSGGPRPTETVKAVAKPWVEGHLPNPSGSGVLHVVAHSDYASDSNEAQRQALDQAVARLEALAESRLARTNRSPLSADDKVWLANAIRDDLTRHGWVADRFAQTIKRPYAWLWRQSLLLAVPEPDFANATRQYANEFARHRTGVRNSILMAGGLALGIIVLYLFLNAATKGYYMWPLRLVGIVAVVAGVCLVLARA